MTVLLLFIIFIAYVGLGIPDSLLGAAWPAMYKDLGLPVSYASFITTVVYAGTIISSFLSSRIIKRFKTANVALVSTLLTALALLGFSYSKSILWFCLLAFPLGIGAGSVDTALNNYVALNYKATHINFLHCFYGVGVTLSPYLMSLALSDNDDWRRGYRIMFSIQITIAFLLLLTLPVWKKVKSNQIIDDENTKIITVFQALRIQKAKSAICVFLGSCGIESVCLVWASTFLVRTHNLTADKAAGAVTIYFIGLTAGRFFSGIMAKKLDSKTIILTGQIVTFIAIILLFTSVNTIVYAGLFLVGLGNGPLFPNMTHLVPLIFGKEQSQSMIGIFMGFSYISILCSPLILGFIGQRLGFFLFPYYMLVMFLLMFASTLILFRKQDNSKHRPM